MAHLPPLKCSIDLGPWGIPPRIVVLEDWRCEMGSVLVVVPEGFVSDGASLPRGKRLITRLTCQILAALLIVFRFGKLRSLRASVAHDALYDQRFNRRAADRIFRKLLAEDGIGLIGRWAAWAGVRLGGWARY